MKKNQENGNKKQTFDPSKNFVLLKLDRNELEVIVHALEAVEETIRSIMEQEPAREMNDEMLRLCALRQKLMVQFPFIPSLSRAQDGAADPDPFSIP